MPTPDHESHSIIPLTAASNGMCAFPQRTRSHSVLHGKLQRRARSYDRLRHAFNCTRRRKRVGPYLTTHRRVVDRRAGTPAPPRVGVPEHRRGTCRGHWLAACWGVACHRTVAGAARWHIRRRGGPHDGACERPARGARLGDEPGTCPALSDRQDHGSTNVCSNQDGFPSSTYVCSNNLHVSGKVWPLASIRCYLVVPSKRPKRPFRNGRPPDDLPQPP